MKQLTKKFIIDLINAGLLGESRKVELAALSLARSFKKDQPDIFNDINQIVSSFIINGGANIRSVGESPIPIDHDSKLDMAFVNQPDLSSNPIPILTKQINDRIEDFLNERENINLLIEKNIRPSSSLLLTGLPGTGKTMLAKFIASSLNKNLITLDLSASISSLMGKTGANLKKVIEYAKNNSSVLLFDEFDAIAKKRDDNTDLGEIKRVVNILLMELEDWPISSLFIATSNHPELLDKAIWRRFDHSIEIPIPDQGTRLQILKKELGDFFDNTDLSLDILEPISSLHEGKSAADICKYANNVKRRNVLKNESLIFSLFEEIEGFREDKKLRAVFCITAKELLKDKITVRELSKITGLSISGVQHHLSKQ
ncbi:AAA family ATPase [Tenacibaculum sp. TC6]|uniref:AAA family ATPase n=1 Tax=Tenacibaculum sp. TC6 TaxID=3423223 RepID=UPI003D3689A2